MERPPDFAGFSDVDRAGTPGAYADFLDGVGAIAAVAEWKERSFALLNPRPGAVLVDVGCGTGEDVLALAARVQPGGRAIGVDASEAMLAEARRRADGRPGVALVHCDAHRLDLPDACADGVRAERTLQHLDDPAAAAREMARVVRPGGRVVVAEPDWGTLVVDCGDPAVAGEVAAAAAGRLRSAGAGRTLRRLLLDAGLVDVELVARTLLITDRAHAETLFDLTGAAQAAVQTGRLTQAQADTWLDALADAGARGRLLAAMTAFMACARRPGHDVESADPAAS